MDDPTVRPKPADNLAGSIRESLGELSKISEALDSGIAPSVTMAVMIGTLAEDLRDAAAARAVAGSLDPGRPL
ncbi:MAG TPA: hypothetical protein VK586_07210 [Streptosporangiaceae bacterium]|nr:hypothetical protein [Streptosporangiaceae bacterium]